MNFQDERDFFISYLEELLSTPYGDLPDEPLNKKPTATPKKPLPNSGKRATPSKTRSSSPVRT